MKNYIFIVYSLLYMQTVYMMELQKQDTSKEKFLDYICNPFHSCISTTRIKVSHGKFKDAIFPLDLILNGCPNLVTCKATNTNMTTVSLEKEFKKHNYLRKLDLSNNVLTHFNIGKLLRKCVELKHINLEQNITLQDISWQNNDHPLPKYQLYPSVNLKKTALTLKSKELLYNRYIAHHNNQSNNLDTIAFSVLGTLLLEGMILNACKYLIGIEFSSDLCGWLMLGSSIIPGYLVKKKLSEKTKKRVHEKLIY